MVHEQSAGIVDDCSHGATESNSGIEQDLFPVSVVRREDLYVILRSLNPRLDHRPRRFIARKGFVK